MPNVTSNVYHPTSRSDFIRAFKRAVPGDLVRVGDSYWQLLKNGSWQDISSKQIMRGAPTIKKSVSSELFNDVDYFPWLEDSFSDVDRNSKKLLGLLGVADPVGDASLAGISYDFAEVNGTLALKKSAAHKVTGRYVPFSLFYSRSPALAKVGDSDPNELMYGTLEILEY